MIKKNDEEESNVDNFIENLDDSEEDEDESNTDSTLLATCGEFYFCVTRAGRRNSIIFPQRAREGVLIFEFYCIFTH